MDGVFSIGDDSDSEVGYEPLHSEGQSRRTEDQLIGLSFLTVLVNDSIGFRDGSVFENPCL